MGRYIARRVVQAAFTLVLVLFLLHVLQTFAIQANGNPALAFFGDKVPTDQQVAAVEKRFNLEEPCFDQPLNPCLGPFVERLQDYASGDFGTNLRGDRTVTDMLSQAVPNTLRLFTIVAITWFVLGMLLGSVAARFRGKAPDTSIRFLTILYDAFPVFVSLLVYKYIFSVPIGKWMKEQFGDGSIPHMVFQPSFKEDAPWLSMVMPGLLLGIATSAEFVRLVRASQLENYNSDHVRTARSKGLGEVRVTIHHIIRNSSIPIVTAVGILFADALAGAVITEGLMNIQGMGGLLWESVRNSDVSVVLGVSTVVAIAIIVVTLLVDLAYAALDPRIRYD